MDTIRPERDKAVEELCNRITKEEDTDKLSSLVTRLVKLLKTGQPFELRCFMARYNPTEGPGHKRRR
jgi:hypothetical protein